MFFHGDIWHLVGNMLFLWVFGDNVEDAVGHIKFLIFYFACGIFAAAALVSLSLGHALGTVRAELVVSENSNDAIMPPAGGQVPEPASGAPLRLVRQPRPGRAGGAWSEHATYCD